MKNILMMIVATAILGAMIGCSPAAEGNTDATPAPTSKPEATPNATPAPEGATAPIEDKK